MSWRFRRPTVARPEWLYTGRFRCKICDFTGRTWTEVASHLIKTHKITGYANLKENVVYLEAQTPEAELRRREKRSQKIISFARYEPLAGMSQIEELERKTEEASKEEQRIKEELKGTEEEYKRIIKEIVNTIDTRRGDEARDSSTYFNLSQKYKDIPTVSKIFLELSEAEDSHQKKLLLLGNALEREIGLYSEKYKAFR